MGLTQKYMEKNNVVSLSSDVILKLNYESEHFCDQLFDSIEMIDNDLIQLTALGLIIKDKDDEDIYLQIQASCIHTGKYIIFDYKKIDVDKYLDLILEGNIFKTNEEKIRLIC